MSTTTRKRSRKPWRVLGGIALALSLLVARPAGATTLTLSQDQLFALDDITSFFGGNGRITDRTLDRDGVLFEIEGGTIDYGKVAARARFGRVDFTPYDAFGLHVEVVAAPNPVEVKPFAQTESLGLTFVEDSPGEKVQGDAFDSFVPLVGVPHLDWGYALGFQYFTAGGVENPTAQTVQLYVAPVAGADVIVIVPEPTTGLLVTLGVLAVTARSRSSRGRSFQVGVE